MFKVWTYLHGNSVVSQLTFVRSWCWKFEHLQGSNYVINFICHKVSSYKHLRGSSHLLINFHLHGYLQVINICARTAFEKLEFTQLYKSYDFSSQRLLLKTEQTIVKFNHQQYKNQRHLRILSPSKDKEGCSVYVFVRLWRFMYTKGKPLPCWSIKLLPTSGIYLACFGYLFSVR